MEREPAVYIVASGFRGTIYIGVTSNLLQRVYQHRDGTFGGFTARYGCKRLVWFETGGSMDWAIAREKQLKNWTRAWKVALTWRRISGLSRWWSRIRPGMTRRWTADQVRGDGNACGERHGAIVP